MEKTITVRISRIYEYEVNQILLGCKKPEDLNEVALETALQDFNSEIDTICDPIEDYFTASIIEED
jgi:hypothetical protein